MKKLLLFGMTLLAWNVSAQSVLIETPAYDGVVVVTGAPAPQTVQTPVVYDQPVVYTAPVQYNAPVVYNGPVVYNNATVDATAAACANDLSDVCIKVYPRRNCYNPSTVMVIGNPRVR